MKKIIAADIGGTSSRFAVFTYEQKQLSMGPSVWFESDRMESFSELLAKLPNSELGLSANDVDALIIAAAGPVRDGTYCAPPNNTWDIDLRQVAKQIPSNAIVLNDFSAQAYACRSKIGAEATTILSGTDHKQATVGVIGAGTGLGKAYLLYDSNRWVAGASEGGHEMFPVENSEELAFMEFVAAKEGAAFATWDMVVSGRGLVSLHQHLTGAELTAPEIAASLNDSSETMRWFARFYGRVCRNFALDILSYGGLYIAGGVAAKNPAIVQHEEFRQSFYHSPVHVDLLKEIPLRLISDEQSGLWGAALAGQQLLD